MYEPTDVEKAVFQAARERRKKNNIRLGRLTITLEAKEIEDFYEIWPTWVSRWGKRGAFHVLMQAMSTIEVGVREVERAGKSQRRSSNRRSLPDEEVQRPKKA
jgi:hypothetical protein